MPFVPAGLTRRAEAPCLGVHSGTAPLGEDTYTLKMKLKYAKVMLACVWICAVSGAGLVGDVSSLSSWTVLAGFAILPPLILMQWWNEPAQTISESIHEVLR
jgi:hypothetical protein